MIKPEDLMASRATAEECARFEKKLDAAIQFADLMSKWPATLGIRGTPRAVVDEVIAKYRSHWSIEFVTDPRDGNYVKIEEPLGSAAPDPKAIGDVAHDAVANNKTLGMALAVAAHTEMMLAARTRRRVSFEALFERVIDAWWNAKGPIQR